MAKRVMLLGALLGVLIGFAFLCMRRDAVKTQPPKIDKQPIVFASHTFDPAAPPPEMPPLNPGEAAECDTAPSLRRDANQKHKDSGKLCYDRCIS